MTFLPHENRNVKGLHGPAFPKYKVGPTCCAPGCSRFADHAHHLWRRSFIGGDFHWVELWDHTIMGNIVGLCWRCHEMVTRNEVWMRLVMVEGSRPLVVWNDNSMESPPPIFPQPPLHAPGLKLAGEVGVPVQIPEPGPAAVATCPGCHRPLPQKRDESQPRDMSRRRKTWTVQVPDDGEDGALVLDTLIEGCREIFSHSDDSNVRYFTLVQALALVVQHGHAFLSES